MRTHFFPICALILVAGCAGNQSYLEPTETSAAVVELINNTNGSVMGPFIYAKPEQCSDRKVTTSGMMLKEKYKTFKVKSDEATVFSVNMPESSATSNVLVTGFGVLGLLASDAMYKDCKPVIEFVPKKDFHYVLTMNTTKNGCEYSFKSKMPSGEDERDFTFKARKFNRPFSESGPWCE